MTVRYKRKYLLPDGKIRKVHGKQTWRHEKKRGKSDSYTEREMGRGMEEDESEHISKTSLPQDSGNRKLFLNVTSEKELSCKLCSVSIYATGKVKLTQQRPEEPKK